MPTKPYKTHLFERLQTTEDRVGYLRAAFEEDEATFERAVKDVCESVNFIPLAEDRVEAEKIVADWRDPFQVRGSDLTLIDAITTFAARVRAEQRDKAIRIAQTAYSKNSSIIADEITAAFNAGVKTVVKDLIADEDEEAGEEAIRRGGK